MARKHRIRIVGLSAGLLIIAAAGWALRPRVISVETFNVSRRPFAATITAEGRSRVKDLYVVTTPVNGNLERIESEAGDTVKPDLTLARVWPVTAQPLDARSSAEAQAAVAAASAAVVAAEAAEKEATAAVAHAESKLNTVRTLAGKDLAPKLDLEHAQHEAEIRHQAADAARAQVASARAELTRAQTLASPQLKRSSGPAILIRSPVSGRVLRVLRQDAGPVMAGTGLLEIGNLSTLEFVADLLTADAMRVRSGASAWIRDWGDDRPIAARVRRVEPAAFTKISALGLEEQRVRVVLDLAAARPRDLGHAFRVNVSIVVWTGENVLAIPSTALFRAGDHWALFTVENGRARMKRVKVGLSDDAFTAIDEGLSPEERVIVQPSDLIKEGTRVRAVLGSKGLP